MYSFFTTYKEWNETEEFPKMNYFPRLKDVTVYYLDGQRLVYNTDFL